MKNKSLLFIAILLLQFTSLAQSGWVQQTSGTTENLNSVFFVNSDVGWVAGNAGTVLSSADGGTNWSPQTINTNNDLTSVQFVDTDNGWIVGEGSLYRTTDGGLNWVDISDTVDTRCVFFIDENTGWRGARNNGEQHISKSTDGGINWIQQYTFSNPFVGFIQIQFIDHNHGWASYGGIQSYILYRTSNGGEDWNNLGNVGTNAGYAFCFIDSSNGWSAFGTALSPSAEINFTSDGGISWQQQFFRPWFIVFSTIFFIDIDRGWTAGDSIYYTNNSGVDWTSQDCGVALPINDILFTDENIGWAVGEIGTILHTTTGGVVSVEGERSDISDKYNITQNFPNPFNPSTKIKYAIPQISQVQIKVFDVLGNEIETLVNEVKPIGTYELNWYAEGLPSGVYFYQLRAGNFIETKKMILIK